VPTELTFEAFCIFYVD